MRWRWLLILPLPFLAAAIWEFGVLGRTEARDTMFAMHFTLAAGVTVGAILLMVTGGRLRRRRSDG
ncbi:MAG TPA: hypothetical protein VM434_05605 [Beijerinckiaceae bacterium]|nr:hypothetical protein [Beijerinckiaceae bacterium]